MKVLLLMVIVALVVFTKCYGQQKEMICTGAQLMAAIRYACKLERRSFNAPRGYFGGTNSMGSRGPLPADDGAIDYYEESPSEENYEILELPIRLRLYPRRHKRENGDDFRLARPHIPKPPFFPFFWPTAAEPLRFKRNQPIGYMTTEQMRQRCCEHGCTKDDFRGACHFDD